MKGLLNKSKSFISKHSPTILTVVGGVGVVVTTVSAVQATTKASKLLEEAEREKGEKLTKVEIAKVAIPSYIPTVLFGTSTIACIVGANILNKRKQAALISAYAFLDSSYREYRKKVTQLYGEGANTEVRTEIAKDKYDEADISEDGETQLFYDSFSERYFNSTMEQVLTAEYSLNRALAEQFGLYLNEFYEYLNIPTVPYGDYLGWSSYELTEAYWVSWVDFKHTKVVMEDGLECTVIEMVMEPTFDFENY